MKLFSKFSFTNRLSLIAVSSCLIIFTLMSVYLYKVVSNDKKEALAKRLYYLAVTGAEAIPYKTHRKLVKKVVYREDGFAESKEYKTISKKLKNIKELNGLQSDVYTVFIHDSIPDKMIFVGISESEKPSYAGNALDITPLIKKVYETKKASYSDIYRTESGRWVSGAAPILTKSGKIHAIIQVDFNADKELKAANEQVLKVIVLPLICASFFLFLILRVLILNSMKKILSGIGNLQIITEKVFHVANKTKKISVDLNERAGQQSLNIKSTFDSLKNIKTKVQDTVENSLMSAKESENSKMLSIDGRGKVTEMLSSMDDIHQSNLSSKEKVDETLHDLKSILGIMKDINQNTADIEGIVFQTKLLSFNASVEAARAGEHGKGFSVVAEEIGNLATVSGTSANKISEILGRATKQVESIISHTSSTFDNVTKDSLAKVENGKLKATQSNTAFENIQGNINKLDERVKSISTACEDQNERIVEIFDDMEQLDNLTRDNSNVSRTSLKISEELGDYVTDLEGVVSSLNTIIKGDSSQKKNISKMKTKKPSSKKNKSDKVPLKIAA